MAPPCPSRLKKNCTSENQLIHHDISAQHACMHTGACNEWSESGGCEVAHGGAAEELGDRHPLLVCHVTTAIVSAAGPHA